ncbi:MAG: 30S ribosomal protein S1 [Bacteroides sp.]|nr:MAG: 30S ribosomal protein S1 [Bacteroides sp.]
MYNRHTTKNDLKDNDKHLDQKDNLYNQYIGNIPDINNNDIIEGTVVGISDKDIIINIGFKSEGFISKSEFKDLPDIKVGDVINVYIENKEDRHGQLVLSYKRAIIQKAWNDINDAFSKNTVMEGFVKNRTKGGLIVDINGIEAFLPGSQIDVKPIKDYDQYVNKNIELKVIKINHDFKNVVVSHKVLIEKHLEKQKMEIISKLEKGQVLEGYIKNITDFGAFIDLGGVDGLLHITDISWGRIGHPKDILKIDQKINVVVLDFDEEKKRISLGYKQLYSHPWDTLDISLVEGSKVQGKVVTIADYGVFIEITPGVEGLIHISEMSWSQKVKKPQEHLQIGDFLEAVILTIDRKTHKMSLGIKQLKNNPWKDIEIKYPVGSRHKGKVSNITNFGIFVELEEGLDGLVHISEISWLKKVNHPSEFTQIGDKIDVIVLEAKEKDHKLSLGHKQIEDNPWNTFEKVFAIDTIHKGTVITIDDKGLGANISTSYGIECFVPIKHMLKSNGSNIALEEINDFKVIEFNKNTKRIIMSHTKTWQLGNKIDKKLKPKININKNKSDKTTLGEIEALAELKKQLDNNK